MPEPEYQEVTLADLVRTLFRRKLVLASVFLLVLLGGVAYAVFQEPTYESRASIVTLEHGDIIKNWLESRQAGEDVAEAVGDPVVGLLFASRWDPSAEAWDGEPPSRQEAGEALRDLTTIEYTGVRPGLPVDRLLKVTVRHNDPIVTREVADAYVESLQELRPLLINITRDERFERFYQQSGNEQAARAEAEKIAQNREYWRPLDDAATGEQVGPNTTLHIALSVVLALMLSVFAVFFVEWASQYRAERRPLDVPRQDAPKKRAPAIEPGRTGPETRVPVKDRQRYR